MLNKIPFFIGNLAACLVYGTENRRLVRAYVNLFFFFPVIYRFIRYSFGVRIHSIKFIRQRTLGRVVYLVNDKYYVKIFRDVSNRRLKDFAFISNYVRPHIGVVVPRVVVAQHAPMYACARVRGRHITTFPADKILKNEKKIKNQVLRIIDQLQSINVNDIPDRERFMDSMQTRTVEKPGRKKYVLAHFDLNETNLLFDKDLNVCAVIDWDTLSIAQNPETDKDIFMKYWNWYINSL